MQRYFPQSFFFLCFTAFSPSSIQFLMENFMVWQHPPKTKFPFHLWKVYQWFSLSTPCLMHIWSGFYTCWSGCVPLDALGKWLWRSGSSVLSSSSHLPDFKVSWRKAASVTGVKVMFSHVDMLGLRQFGKAADLTLTFLGKPVDLHEELMCSYPSSIIADCANTPLISA